MQSFAGLRFFTAFCCGQGMVTGLFLLFLIKYSEKFHIPSFLGTEVVQGERKTK